MAATLLKLTPVAPVRLVPSISTTEPVLPLAGEKLVIVGAGGLGALFTVTNLAQPRARPFESSDEEHVRPGWRGGAVRGGRRAQRARRSWP